MTPFIGIDPGVGGALALLIGDALEIHDMPSIQDGSKRRVDHAQLAVILDGWAKHQGVCAYVERVNAMPGEGVSGAFSFGCSVGVILGAVAANFIPLERVSPVVWKRALAVPTDKDGARLRASALLPRHAGQWPLKKHHGRAEAALIALWGSRHMERAAA